MSDHVLFCVGEARREAAGGILERLEGWCFSNRLIRSLLLAHPGGEFQTVPYGFVRPDVARAYPDYPSALRSGFRCSTRYSLGRNGGAVVGLELEGADGTPEFHSLLLQPMTRDVQTIPLTEATRLSGAAEQALAEAIAQAADPEARLRRSLGRTRGLTLRLDIINKCNLRCVMCHFSDDAVFQRPTSQFTAEEFKKLFDEIGPHVREVMLSCGDEPLTSKFLPDILRYLASQHPEVAIEFCTNAMLMRAPMRKLIMETRVARLLFSMDAVSQSLLESIRVGCRFGRLVGNIKALQNLKSEFGASRPAFIFNFVMMKRNIHEAPAFVHLAHALGAESVDFRHVVPIASYYEPEELLVRHPARFNFYRERIIREAAVLGLAYYLPEPLATDEHWEPNEEVSLELDEFRQVEADPVGDYLPDLDLMRRPALPLHSWEGSPAEEFGTTFCARPFSEIMIRDQKEVLPCPWHNRPLGYLRQGQTLTEIFFGPEFQALRRNMLKPEGDVNCAGCPIKSEHLPTQQTQ